MEYFLIEISKITKNKFRNEQRNLMIYSKIMEQLFYDVSSILDNFQMHLIAYLKNMRNKNKIKSMMNNHKTNLKNIKDVFYGYISNRDALREADADNIVVNELNIEIRRSSQSKLESIFVKITGDGKNFRPDFSSFENLAKHSYGSEGVNTTLTVANVAKIYNACMDN